MQIDVLKNSLRTTEIKEIRKNNYDVTLANIFTQNASICLFCKNDDNNMKIT